MHPSPVNFDRLAPFYRMMEFLSAGDKLQRCRIEFLKEIPVPRRILLAGEGHGRFLPKCIEQFPDARILVVDSSERMLQIARSKVNSSRVEFVHADLLEWDGPRDEFDLIVTNFFLDCFPADELEKVVAKLSAMATSKGDWLLADFEIARMGWARLRSRIILASLYQLFRIFTRLKARSLVPPDAEIVKNGFALHRRETYEWGLLKSEWWRRNS